jgi:hypothetical protein
MYLVDFWPRGCGCAPGRAHGGTVLQLPPPHVHAGIRFPQLSSEISSGIIMICSPPRRHALPTPYTRGQREARGSEASESTTLAYGIYRSRFHSFKRKATSPYHQ